MAVHDGEQPYMIYDGPRPPRPVDEEPIADDTAKADVSGVEEEADDEQVSLLRVGLLVGGTLAVGIAIGIWLAPTLRPPDPVASLKPTAPPALSANIPAAATAPAPIEAPPLPAQVAPEPPASVRTDPAPRRPRAPAARASSKQPIKAVASQPAEAARGCKASGSRVQMALCADASIAAADREMRDAYQRALRSGTSASTLRADQDDWLVYREEAARRSPGGLAEAYRQRIAELNVLADDPPH